MTKRQAALIREGVVAANENQWPVRLEKRLVARAYIRRMETLIHERVRRQVRSYARRSATYSK